MIRPIALNTLADRISSAGCDDAERLGSDAWALLAPGTGLEPEVGNPGLSLDACRALQAQVLPDWQATITFGSPLSHVALHRHGRPIHGAAGQAASPELAWLVAMLRTVAGDRF